MMDHRGQPPGIESKGEMKQKEMVGGGEQNEVQRNRIAVRRPNLLGDGGGRENRGLETWGLSYGNRIDR